MLKNNRKTLADKIAGVLNTTPANFDPEDDNIDDTGAKLIDDFTEDNRDDEELLSAFRRQNVELLGDVDERYSGKKASRKSLYDSDEDTSETDQSDQENAENIGSENGKNDSADDENESVNSSDEVDEEGQSDESDGDDESLDENFDGEIITRNEEDFKHFNNTDVSAQVKKGRCIRNQMNMWENLLETRIQLQKCLIAANQMPQKDIYTDIKKQSDPEFSDQVSVTKNSLMNLLDKLLLLQKLSLSNYPETKKLIKNSSNAIKEIDAENDEEIPSDTEDEELTDDEIEDSEVPKKKRRLNDFENDINERHSSYKSYRNNIIQKWYDKTRIAMLKNNANSHSVLNHIEHTLSDRSKLIKKTQQKRSDYIILGQESPAENGTNEDHPRDHLNDKNGNKPTGEYNTEIFDDDDFYHQLLRELIEVKSADLTDPIQLGRQWIQLQKLRSKMKRKIDTKATKGRKIRYTVHTKLVNFMAPIDEYLWTDQAKTDLFSSLFGKKEYSSTS